MSKEELKEFIGGVILFGIPTVMVVLGLLE